MRQEEKIKTLEAQLQAEEERIKGLFRSDHIPGPSDYLDLDRIKNELKAARRVKAMDAKRSDPKLTRQIGIKLTEDEFQALTSRATAAGLDLSKYVRNLLKV